MKHNLGLRFTIIIAVIGFLGFMAYLGVGRDRLELGIDLKGGSELIFKFEFEEGTNKKELLTEAISVIQERIDGYGLKDIVLQPIGEDRFAVQISAKDKEKVDAVKDLITDLGHLQFRITVEPKASDNYAYYWKLFDEARKKRIDEETASFIGPADIKGDEKDRFPEGLRWYRTADDQRLSNARLGLDEAGEPLSWVLCEVDTLNVSGEHLKNVYHAREQGGLGTGWAVYFKVEKLAQGAMSKLTSYEEDKYMAIILNGKVTSAPILQSTLSDSGQITGGFTEKTSRRLAAILQAGALQEAPDLSSERTIAPDLAGSARRTGMMSTLIGFVFVLLLMVWLYRKPGLLANLALLLNLIILLGVLTWFEAVLTLPGIAGVVLTVGMAVDANILVFERIKEERAKGRTVAQAIATGYDRALVTIVDANLTTLITAYFLFQIGSGPVRGFGITLAVGIIASMFTALYVTRSIFELGLRKKWVTEARMRGEWKVPSIPWMSFKRTAAWASALAMLLGVFLWEAVPEKARYDLDFTKGSKLIVRFHKELTVDEVHDRLAAMGDSDPIYKDIAVRASAEGIGQNVGVDASEGFELRSQNIATQVQIDDLRERLSTTFLGEILPGPFQSTLRPGATGGSVGTIYFLDPETKITKGLLEAVLDQYTTETKRLGGVEVAALDRVPGAGAVFRLAFKEDVDAAGISLNLREAFEVFKLGAAVTKYETAATSDTSTQAEQDHARLIVEELGRFKGHTNETDQFPKAFFKECDPFPLADRIDPSTAEEHRDAAVRAVALSILGIIIYVAFRFRSWYFGFAAVAALIHDVLVVLGLVALVNWLGVVDARLNLVTVAAFLTLIGYSINDSIVVFDRIRENRVSERTRLRDIIDRSINQTLSRTLRTTGTTWVVVAILFFMNLGANSSLEGFAFILALGVLVGTYSSIFIASPALLYLPWLWERCGSSLKGLTKVALPYVVVGAAAVLGISYARGELTFEGDFSVAAFNSLALGIPVGLLALFVVNFLRFVGQDDSGGEPARAG